MDPGSQKWPKSVLLRKIEQLYLRPASEIIFSVKNFSLIVVTGIIHPRPGKILYVEKNDLKMTKNRLFGYGVLTTFRKSYFSTMKIGKYTLPETTLKTCNGVLFFNDVYDRRN